MVDYVKLIAEVAEKYYKKAQERKLACTASLDEIRSAYAAVAELHSQGLDNYSAVKLVIESALVKDDDCAQVFDDAWTEVLSELR